MNINSEFVAFGRRDALRVLDGGQNGRGREGPNIDHKFGRPRGLAGNIVTVQSLADRIYVLEIQILGK